MSEGFRLPENMQMGRVRLRVADLQRSLAFYRDRIGLHVLEVGPGTARLGAPVPGPMQAEAFEPEAGVAAEMVGAPSEGAGDAVEILRLEESPGAAPAPRGANGLYHFAVLFPHRRFLAQALVRVHRSGWMFQGFSDHAVSEAIYLADPDGNGLEMYADRPRETWRWTAGEVHMTTRPLDLDNLLRELESPAAGGRGGGNGPGGDGVVVPPGTRVGHIHLHVSDLKAAEEFYSGLLGLDVVARSYPGALFMSAGGYHHHVAVNVWGTRRPVPPDGEHAGLLDFALVVPDADARETLYERLERASVPVERVDGRESGMRVTDPDGNRVVILEPRGGTP